MGFVCSLANLVSRFALLVDRQLVEPTFVFDDQLVFRYDVTNQKETIFLRRKDEQPLVVFECVVATWTNHLIVNLRGLHDR